MQIELVIFDCDGVLVDSERLGNRILVQFLAELGLAINLEEAIRLFRGCKMADCVAVIEQRLGHSLPSDFVAELRARTAQAFVQELRPVDGVREALQEISLPVCVASSGPREKIKLALSTTGLLTRFERHIFSSYEIGKWKPEPDLFLHAARSMGFCPASCAVIEDSVLGVRAGVSAGMSVFGYCGGDEKASLGEHGAHVFDAMRELPSLLSRRHKPPST